MKNIKGYEVLRFIRQGSVCRSIMDYTEGTILMELLKVEKKIRKERLFEWFFDIFRQAEGFHRCGESQYYGCLNPYGILVTREGKILLLDPGSKEFLKKIDEPAVKKYFVENGTEKMKYGGTEADLYSAGKTLQFMLYTMEIVPDLRFTEEIQMKNVIKRCLGETRKRYRDFRQPVQDMQDIRKNKKSP